MERAKINIYNRDCLEVMKEMPDNAYDLAIVDPEYGINVNHNMGRRKGQKSSNHKKVTWDSRPPDLAYFKELFRVSKNQIVWGANHFISRMPYDSPCWLMWDKGFSEDVTFAQFELAWTSFNGTCKKFYKNPNQTNRIHPTQKPVDLYKWKLNRFAKEGDKILDTHYGSGSIGLACWDMKFDLDAFEIDAEYFKAAVERLEKHKKQLQLF